MAKKRYFNKYYGEEFYIFDSNTIKEKEVDEKIEYDGYKAFEDSMTGDEVVDQLNKQESKINYLQRKLDRERRSTTIQFEKWDKQANEKIQELRDTLAYRSNQLAFAEQLIEDLGGTEMKNQWREFND